MSNGFDMEELKQQYEFHFNLPQHIKDFLHQLSQTPTFKKTMDERLESVEDKYQDFVKDNRWLLFGWEIPYPNDKIVCFGEIGRRRYDKILKVEVNLETGKTRLIRGYCHNLYCENPATTITKVPKHTEPLVEQLKKFKGDIR